MVPHRGTRRVFKNPQDVTGKRWGELCKETRRQAPIRILILGVSIKLTHDTTGAKFKKLMLDKFGFEENAEDSRSEILVEFFNDDYEDLPAAVKSLMEVFRKHKDKAFHLSEDLLYNVTSDETPPSSTFVCFTGRRINNQDFHVPDPEAPPPFWKELYKWTEEKPDENICNSTGRFFTKPRQLKLFQTGHDPFCATIIF